MGPLIVGRSPSAAGKFRSSQLGKCEPAVWHPASPPAEGGDAGVNEGARGASINTEMKRFRFGPGLLVDRSVHRSRRGHRHRHDAPHAGYGVPRFCGPSCSRWPARHPRQDIPARVGLAGRTRARGSHRDSLDPTCRIRVGVLGLITVTILVRNAVRSRPVT